MFWSLKSIWTKVEPLLVTQTQKITTFPSLPDIQKRSDWPRPHGTSLSLETNLVEDFCLGPEVSTLLLPGPPWLPKWMASSFRIEEPFTLGLGEMDNPNATCCPGEAILLLCHHPHLTPNLPHPTNLSCLKQQATEGPHLPRTHLCLCLLKQN